MQENLSTPYNYVTINNQFIEDLSFENNPKNTSMAVVKQPQVDIALDINAGTAGDNIFKVVLGIQAKATIEENIIFLVDLKYAGVFTIEQMEGQEREKVLLVHCPNVIFPYARRIISDVTRDGGYPPLMIAPIDFLGLYNKRMQEPVEHSNITIN